MFSLETKGSFIGTRRFLKRVSDSKVRGILNRYGQMGVEALSSATPKDSGKTASSWGYNVKMQSGSAVLSWTNSNTNKGVNIAIILQYGHGTGTGGYVQGRDYINPAMRPVFDKIVDDLWKEVTRG